MYRLVIPRSKVFQGDDGVYLNANDAKLINSLGKVLFWAKLETESRLIATFSCVDDAKLNKLLRFNEAVIFLPGLQKALLTLILARVFRLKVVVYNGYNISSRTDWKSRVTWFILKYISSLENVKIILNAPVDYLKLKDISSNLSITRPVTSFFSVLPTKTNLPFDDYYCWIGNLSLRKNIKEAKLISRDENVIFIGGDIFSSRGHVGVGRLAAAEIKYILEKSKGLLITSASEGFPRSAIEAASIGVPVYFSRRFDYVLAEEVIFGQRFYEWNDKGAVDSNKYSEELHLYFEKRLLIGKDLVDVIEEK